MIAANVPAELRALRQWCCWDLRQVDGRPKPAKVPLSTTGGHAKTDNPATWATFDECVAAAKERKYSGVGFVFTAGDGYVGVDLDGMSWADAQKLEGLTALLPCYVEVSQSGNGIHLIMKGKLPVGGNRKGPIEMYQHGRYFAITGVSPDGDLPVDVLEDRTEALAAFHAKHIGGFVEPGQGGSPALPSTLPAEDEAFVDRVIRGVSEKESEQFQALYYGGAGDDASEQWVSERRFAMVKMFCRYSADDAQIKRVMWASKLATGKWSGHRTLLDIDIRNARKRGCSPIAADSYPRARTLAELRLDPDAGKPPQPLIPRFAFRGRMTIYTAPDKGGKSTLLTAGVAALLAGATFLGEPCNPAPDPGSGGRLVPQQGTAMWAMLEEHPNDLVIRAGEWGVDPDRLYVVERPRDAVATIRGEAERVKPDVLVIDTLIEYAKLAAPDSGAAMAWNQIMNGLLDIARDLNIGVVILHHARRSDGKARDSGDITARCDVVIEQLSEHSSGVQKLKVRGRYSRLRDFKVRLNETEASKRYELVLGNDAADGGEPADTGKLRGERKKVLQALTGDMSFGAWCKAYGGNPNTFKAEVRELRKQDLVTQHDERGTWSRVQLTVTEALAE